MVVYKNLKMRIRLTIKQIQNALIIKFKFLEVISKKIITKVVKIRGMSSMWK